MRGWSGTMVEERIMSLPFPTLPYPTLLVLFKFPSFPKAWMNEWMNTLEQMVFSMISAVWEGVEGGWIALNGALWMMYNLDLNNLFRVIDWLVKVCAPYSYQEKKCTWEKPTGKLPTEKKPHSNKCQNWKISTWKNAHTTCHVWEWIGITYFFILLLIWFKNSYLYATMCVVIFSSIIKYFCYFISIILHCYVFTHCLCRDLMLLSVNVCNVKYRK